MIDGGGRRVCICATQVPFAWGGAEILVDCLRDQLRARGFEADVVTLPFQWPTRLDLLQSSLAWRLLDLRQVDGKRVDLVIASRFPSYLIRHPNKVVWLIHQLRQVYDLLGTGYSDFDPRQAADARAIEMVHGMDRRGLGEARAVFTISANVAARLEKHNGIAARVLHPPPRLDGRLRGGAFGDYVFTIGRLDEIKRVELLVRAVAHTASPVRARIAGTGPEREALGALAARLGVAERVDFLGFVEDAQVVEEYAGSLAVYYAPYDEDYGFVTVEAFQAGKPMVTTADAGGVLELVVDGDNGLVGPPEPREIAARLDRLWRDRALAQRLGEAGRQRVRDIAWDRVIAELTETIA
ncbi:MAG TPA: glycosyltransferase family 4 protein [Thermoanaerobaculia bacterium]|nr:glycosyltransferase family 4 protein [Thermoanaerobaculia bacterium]